MTRSRHRRRRSRLLVVAALVVGAFVTVTVVFFVRPPLGSVADPQAVVVLGGYGARLERGLVVAREDGVHTVVLSTPDAHLCPHFRGVVLDCFQPTPASTQGEARTIAAMARSHHWHRLLVVAGTTQVSRARLRIDRCYGGQVAFVGVDPVGPFRWIWYTAYDEAAMVKALVWQWSC